MLEIKKINNREEWEEFHLGNPYNSFLQSWNWGEFQNHINAKTFRYGLYNKDDLVGICFLKEEKTRFGKALYSPRGPIIDWDNGELVDEVLFLLKKHFETEGYLYLKLDPAVKKEDKSIIQLFDHNGFQEAVMPSQAENPWILEINGKEDTELLQWMREHGRRKKFGNFLSKAKRSGVTIQFAETDQDVIIFGNLIRSLGDRKNLHFHDSEYFIKMKRTLKESVLIPIAYINGEPVAGAVVTAYGREASYIYGASSPKTGQTHATHLLHWETICKVREMGIPRYNFWGVLTDEDYTPNNPGYGYSNFKRSFGGYIEPLIKPMEFVYKKLPYTIYQIQQRKRMKDLKSKGVM